MRRVGDPVGIGHRRTEFPTVGEGDVVFHTAKHRGGSADIPQFQMRHVADIAPPDQFRDREHRASDRLHRVFTGEPSGTDDIVGKNSPCRWRHTDGVRWKGG